MKHGSCGLDSYRIDCLSSYPLLNFVCRSEETRELTKRQLSNTYPCKEIREEFQVANLVASKKTLSNYGQKETRYFPSTVVTFKCSSLGIRYSQYQDLPCRCTQRYRQVYFQARHTNNCRNWKLIPLKINDGCHCQNVVKWRWRIVTPGSSTLKCGNTNQTLR